MLKKLLVIFGVGLVLAVLAGAGQTIAAPEQMAPAMPTGVTATALGARQIKVSWQAVSRASSYKLQRGSSTIASVTGTEYTDSDLAPGSAYTYRIIASNNAGDSPASAYAVATTQAAYDNEPSPPPPVDQATSSTSLSIPAESTNSNISLPLIAGAIGLLLGVGGATLWFQNRRRQTTSHKTAPKNRR